MSSRVDRTVVPVRRVKAERVILDFDADRLKAPFLLRCGAILVDYILLICVPVISLLLGRAFGFDGSKLLAGDISNAGWLIMILLAVTDFVIFPMATGRSFGKMLTGLKIVKIDGSPATLSSLLIRHLIGYPITILTLGLGFLLSVFNQNGRALHDYLAGTIVVYGRRRQEIKN